MHNSSPMRENQSSPETNGASENSTPMNLPNIQSIGGKARAAKLSPQERSEIAQIAAETRWEKEGGLVTMKAIYDGALAIGAMKLPCAVLEDGTRVITSH